MLDEWQQGDFTKDDHPLVRLSLHEDRGVAPKRTDDHAGLIVISQTCDIIRSAERQNTVLVSRLIEVDDAVYQNVIRRSIPRYIAVPKAGDRIVADMTAIMTVDKSLVAKWDRVDGFDPTQRVNFARSIALFFSRPALPDELVLAISRFRSQVLSRSRRLTSPLGKALLCVDEFRIYEDIPGNYQLLVFLVDNPELDGTQSRDDISVKIEASIKGALGGDGLAALGDHPVLITTVDEQTARDYIRSVPLDLNIISHPTAP